MPVRKSYTKTVKTKSGFTKKVAVRSTHVKATCLHRKKV